jgi:hypothetical protein
MFLAGLVAGSVLLSGAHAGHAQATSAPDDVGYSSRPEVVVLRFTEQYGELAGGPDGAEAGSSLTVHGDGRTVVIHPPAHRRAGRHETTLSPAQLRDLLRALLDHGVDAFDPAAVRAGMARDPAARRRVFAASDPSTIRLTYDFLRLPAGRPPEPVVGTVRWVGLRADARQHPDVPALQRLEAMRVRLSDVMDAVVRGEDAP